VALVGKAALKCGEIALLFKWVITGIPNRYQNRVSNSLDSDPDFAIAIAIDHEEYFLFFYLVGGVITHNPIPHISYEPHKPADNLYS
jgi:hypothetical protein